MNNAVALLGSAAARIRFGNLPTEIVMRGKQRILDTLSCLIAGYSGGVSDAIRSYVEAQGGAAQATLLPGGQKTSTGLASFAHAAYIFGLELSDAAPRGTVHPGNEIVPAALAVAESRNSSGADMLAAVVSGYEIEIRVGRSVFQDAFFRGWWTPGMFGAIGPAITAGHLAGLDAQGLANALGIVINMMPTATKGLTDEGVSAKWLIGGQACATGVLAAEMAARGVHGMRDMVRSLLPALADDNHPERLIDSVAPDGSLNNWELLSGILTKYDSTVGPLAGPLDAIFDLLEHNDIRTADIAEIHVDTTQRTASFNTARPQTDIAARGSLQFCLGVAACKRDRSLLLGPAFQTPMLSDAEVLAAAEKVRVTVNKEYDQKYPQSLTRLTITMRDGKTFTQERDRDQLSRYLNPTDDDIAGKFRTIALPVIGAAKTQRVIDIVQTFERAPNVHELVRSLVP